VNIFRLETGASFFFNTTYHDFLCCIVNIFRLEIGASFFFNTTYHDFLRCIVNIFRLENGASFFFNTTYHDFFHCIVNIFTLEIGASFFFNTMYHDFLRCIVNICRLEIRASLFSFNTTYHNFLRCIVNIYGFQIRATGSYRSPHFTTTPSPPHSRPSRHSLPHPSLNHPSHHPLPLPWKYHCLRWLFRHRHLGRHLQCVFCARSINILYCSDRRKPYYGQKRNIRTQVTSPSKSSMNFKELRFAFCIVLLHRKITNENVLDKLYQMSCKWNTRNLPSVCQDQLARCKFDHRNNLLPMFVDHGRGKRTKCSV